MSVEKTIAAIPDLDEAQRKSLRGNAKRQLSNPKMAENAQHILDALMRIERAETEELSEHVRGLPVAQRVVEAFRKFPITELEAKVIQVLLDNPDSTSYELSEKLGWGGQIWHLRFGELCRKREVHLWPADLSDVRDSDFYSGILADLSENNRWSVKPDVAEAFAVHGLKSKA